jgi:outer membrane biosynthesis protein TonB
LPEAKIETPPEIEAPMPRVDIPWPKMSPAEDPSAHKAEQKRKPQPATPTVQTLPPETQPANPIAPAAPTPRLGEMLTDNRRREYEAEFTGSMNRARTAVNRASGRRLTAAQKETVARIGVFLQQADKSRVRDLMQALQLARRADLLGQDLLKSLR